MTIAIIVEAMGGGRLLGLVAERSRDIRQPVGLASAKPQKQDSRHTGTARNLARPGGRGSGGCISET
jgi:hypothetical protein